MRGRYPLHVFIGVLFTVIVLSTGMLIAAVDYINARKLVLNVVGNLFESSAREAQAELRATHEPIRTLVALLAQSPSSAAGGPDGQLNSLPLIRRALDLTPMLSAIYVGFADGGLFYIRRLDFAAARRAERAPAGTAYMVQISTPGDGGSSVRFYDEAMITAVVTRHNPAFPARLAVVSCRAGALRPDSDAGFLLVFARNRLCHRPSHAGPQGGDWG
jgi:hypothetical protein